MRGSTSTKLIGIVAAALLVPGLLTACSGEPAGDHATASAGAEAASAAECMRGKGYDMADPDPSEGMQLQPPDGVDTDQWVKDFGACANVRDEAGDGKGKAKPFPADEKRERAIAKCMREHGFADYPDDPEELGSYEPDDMSAFESVSEQCTAEQG